MTALSRQPDDPGPEIESNPYAPVQFDDRNPERSVAKLGCIVIGEIRLNVIGRAGFCRAWWSLYLPDTSRQAFPATSIEIAKQKLAEQARQWIEAAGLPLAEQSR